MLRRTGYNKLIMCDNFGSFEKACVRMKKASKQIPNLRVAGSNPAGVASHTGRHAPRWMAVIPTAIAPKAMNPMYANVSNQVMEIALSYATHTLKQATSYDGNGAARNSR